MKIIITLIIACVLIFTACSKNEEKNQNNSSNESKKQLESDYKVRGSSNNIVYNKLNDKNIKRKGSIAYPSNDNTTTYFLNNDDEIIHVKRSFNHYPLDFKNDKSIIDQQVHDYMEKDATLKKIDKSNIRTYYSTKSNKNYYASFDLNTDGKVTGILISSQK
ncbi:MULTISPECIES: hypothetical protein [Staphylococcus]|uniref:hypothetical protein n=1 Tax=Staphylococcus TaxID=1279 RepID=UPI000D0316E7|nr:MULTISPECIES: hypothetical protein [Staphylococcus]MCO4357975.1 hypothetical protein [Staphylococcus agnetis]MCO4363327.1 hypothetical protein [Staphylococcus agnetis]NHM74092.1 hypothetical protein [Staphylococcus sp. 11007852]NJH79282.1 hypothetical protein [Staphylococcus agnetis]NJH83758.1 hypothetical protein [Staphylococcus agnetis]